jgi:hypothetical protein
MALMAIDHGSNSPQSKYIVTASIHDARKGITSPLIYSLLPKQKISLHNSDVLMVTCKLDANFKWNLSWA